MFISFIYILIQYLHKGNTTPQQKPVYSFNQKYDILAYFALVTIFRAGNLQFRCQQFSTSYFLVSFHYLWFFLVLLYRTYYFYYILLSCSLDLCVVYYFLMHWNKYSAPCSADESGGSRSFLSLASSQYPMAVLPICFPPPPFPPSHPHPIPSCASVLSIP